VRGVLTRVDELMRQSRASVEFQRRLERVIDYIQQHPNADLSLEALAGVAHFSPFHFHRVFKAYAGSTVLSYVTRSRLQRALFVMRTSPRKRLGQVAAESGFDSLSTFSKVFRNAYGTAPSRMDVRSVSRLLELSLANEGAPDDPEAPARVRRQWRVRIEARPEMSLAFVRVQGGYLEPQSLVDGYLRLQSWIETAAIDRRASLLLGMSMDDPDIVPLHECRYDFCCTVPLGTSSDAIVARRQLPATRWAVLPCEGTLADVGEAWAYLFRDWLPQSGWQAAALPAMEVFHRRPEEIGWDRFDLDCCLPVVPLIRG
jgi:AraC family transcriptional regulator